MSKPFIPLILGTAREGRRSEIVARYMFDILQTFPVETQFIDPRDFVVPYTIASWIADEKAVAWRDIATRANAFLIVSPEYNHSFPGELKILLDQAFTEYQKKPVGVVGVSEGGFGGVRMIEHIQPVLNDFKMIWVPYPIAVLKVEEFVMQSKEERDAVYKEKGEKIVNALIEYSKAFPLS